MAEGGTSHLERVAVSQITTLDHIFRHMAQLAMLNVTTPQFEKIMKLGLKAQSQCARTMETLATLKNPAIIAKQLNMAHQQVVNNAPMAASQPPEQAEPDPPVEEPKALPQKTPEIVPFAQIKSPVPATHALD